MVAALRALQRGRVTPDPKHDALRGFFTIRCGGTVASSPDRVLLRRESGRWVAVYAIFDHDYDRAEHEITAWLSSRREGRHQSSAVSPEYDIAQVPTRPGQVRFEAFAKGEQSDRGRYFTMGLIEIASESKPDD